MKTFIGLGTIQAFIGLGALGGGFMLVRDPSVSALELPMSLLEGSPFPDFLIPGIFLLAVNGIGSLIGAGLSFTRRRYAQEIAIILGAILVAWIVIQVVIIRSFHWLHVLYFILGVVELGFGLYIRRRRFQAA
nr:putative integron gene cassette protein [uncultured bacterium]